MTSLVPALQTEALRGRFLAYQRTVFSLYLVSLVTTMSGMELFSVLTVLGTLFGLAVWPPDRWEWPPFLTGMAAFVSVAVIGILLGDATAAEKWYDITRMRFFLLYVLLFYNLRYFVGISERWLRVLAVACLIVGIYSVFQHFMPLDLVRPEGKKIYRYAIQDLEIGPLVIGTFNHHLTFANIFVLYACLFLAWGLARPRERWGYLALGLLLFLDCIWTGSRAAWVAVPFTIVGILAARARRLLGWGLAGVAVVLSASYALDDGFRERFDRTLFKEDALYNLGPRVRLWHAQWEMFRDHPWFGIGYNNNERHAAEYVDRLYPDRENFYGHAHSTPLQILSSTGIFGSLTFLFLWWQIFAHCLGYVRRVPRSQPGYWLGVAVIAGFVGFHIQGVTQWNFGDAEVLHNLIFFWAVAAALPTLFPVPPSRSENP